MNDDVMAIAHKALGAALVATGLAVGGYFLVFELYAGQGNTGDAFEVWRALNWIMAVAVIVLALVTYAARRALPADANARERLAASARFYGSLALLLLFFNVWFAGRWGTAVDNGGAHIAVQWIATDIALAILAVNVGLRLWRGPERAQAGR